MDLLDISSDALENLERMSRQSKVFNEKDINVLLDCDDKVMREIDNFYLNADKDPLTQRKRSHTVQQPPKTLEIRLLTDECEELQENNPFLLSDIDKAPEMDIISEEVHITDEVFDLKALKEEAAQIEMKKQMQQRTK